MAPKYLLVDWEPGLTAEKVEEMTGCVAHATPLGALVENPRPFDLEGTMEILNEALRPKRRCYCGVYHRSDCPVAGWIT